ncbi:MAG: hypothetical protein ACJA1R_002432, partial [Flavobacteriales bacterium]
DERVSHPLPARCANITPGALVRFRSLTPPESPEFSDSAAKEPIDGEPERRADL